MFIGKIAWFGGWNSKRSNYNRFGFIEVISSDDGNMPADTSVFFHRSAVLTDTKLAKLVTDGIKDSNALKDYLVVFEINDGHVAGKYEATQVKFIADLTSKECEQYKELVEKGIRASSVSLSIIKNSLTNLTKLCDKWALAIMDTLEISSEKVEFAKLFDDGRIKEYGWEHYVAEPVNKITPQSYSERDVNTWWDDDEDDDELVDELVTLHENTWLDDDEDDDELVDELVTLHENTWLDDGEDDDELIDELVTPQRINDVASEKNTDSDVTVHYDGNAYYIFSYVPQRNFVVSSANDVKIARKIWNYKDGDCGLAFHTFTKYLKCAVLGLAKSNSANKIGLVAAPRSASWKPNNMARSIQRIVTELGQVTDNKAEFYNLSQLLYRAVSGDASHTSGTRKTVGDHLMSIQCRPVPFRDFDLVIVMDDVTTQGNTLIACKEILEEKFMNVPIVSLAIAKTSAEYDDNNDKIVWSSSSQGATDECVEDDWDLIY